MDGPSRTTGTSLHISRYSAFQRVNHWITAALFVLLALSGLSMAYPSLVFLSFLFGGGEAARVLHPWFGLALAVSFFLFAVRLVADNWIDRDDIAWMRDLRRVLANKDEGEIGKYNAGQKGVYWSQVILTLVLLVSGLVIWQQCFGTWTTIPTQRAALLIHSLAAFTAIAVIIVHIYAAFWAKGTMRAMVRGKVTGGYAYTHHRKWLRDMLRRGGADVSEG